MPGGGGEGVIVILCVEGITKYSDVHSYVQLIYSYFYSHWCKTEKYACISVLFLLSTEFV